MTITFDSKKPSSDIYEYIRRLETLVDHLRKVTEGRLPTPAELARAPLLDGYRPAIRSSDCLVGVVEGHPLVSGPIVTSELWTFAPNLGWARTLSRLYRLGRPAGVSDSLE